MRGAGVEVAVIDDGVDPDNPDLSGSGKVVDGGDCSGDSCLASGGTTPSGSHGTAVAALVAASEDAQGIVGGAPDATIVSYKVFADAEGSTTNTAVVNAMLAAAARPSVRVLNLSLSGQFSSRIERDALAVIRTSRPDLVVVAAAGNDGRELPNSPAGLDGVLSVGASGQGGLLVRVDPAESDGLVATTAISRLSPSSCSLRATVHCWKRSSGRSATMTWSRR